MKKALCIIIGALLLTACGGDSVSADGVQTSEQSAIETDSATAETEQAARQTTEQAAELPDETAEQPTDPTADAAEPHPEKSAAQLSMERLILDKAAESGAQGELFPIYFGDPDGGEMLVAILGSMEEHDGKPYYYGSLWIADDDYAMDMFGYHRIDALGNVLTDIAVLSAGGDSLLSVTFEQGAEYGSVMLWEMSGSWLHPVDILGCTSVGIAQTEDCGFTAIKTEYGAYSDGTGRTYKPYRYTYDPESKALRQHLLRQATWEQVSALDGADAIAERLGGGEVCDYLLTKEGELYINYTLGRENRYLCYETVNGSLSDITPEDNLGHYAADVTFEQARLEQLILDSVPEEQRRDGYTIGSTLFGDFDGDGIEELAAVYGIWDIWFASGDSAEQMANGELLGLTNTADGTFLNFYTPGTIGGVNAWYHLQNSTLVCSQPEDNYSSRIYYSHDADTYCAEIIVGMDEEHGGWLWETVTVEFDKEKRRFVIIDN